MCCLPILDSACLRDERTGAPKPPLLHLLGMQLRVWCVGLSLIGFVAAPVRGQGVIVDKDAEYNIKTAFVYNFGRYTSWPASAFEREPASFVIGVLGESPLASRLEQVARSRHIVDRRTKRELSIEVQRFPSFEKYVACQILIIPEGTDPATRIQVINALRGQPVLLVGESEGFAADGGTIRFFLSDGRVKFRLNLDAAREKNLSIDAKLLQIAEIVSRPTVMQQHSEFPVDMAPPSRMFSMRNH